MEFDIKGLFDNIDHELLNRAVRKHTDSKWIILYIERFLKAVIKMSDGTIQQRKCGTPQGGVISPVLANLFMHYAFDMWIKREFLGNQWVRYADDGIIHCKTKEEAEYILGKLKERMLKCKLEIHPEKTRIVYCRSDKNIERHKHEYFDFLGYTFRRRLVKSKYGNFFNAFTPAVSKEASQKFRDRIREIRRNNKIVSIEKLVEEMNPVIRGWANYFSKFCSREARKVLDYVNLSLIKWCRKKYKRIRGSKGKAYRYLARLAKSKFDLFYHWEIGIRPMIG